MPPLLQEIGNKHKLSVLRAEPVTGGDINRCYKLSTQQGTYFIKLNEAGKFPGMMQTEAMGLQVLANTQTFRIPAIIDHGVHYNEWQYLLLEWLEPGHPSVNFGSGFGERLAALHAHTEDAFGLSFNNYIGLLPQQNGYRSRFPDFYAALRILPQVKALRDKGLYTGVEASVFETLCIRLPEFIPEEPPAQIHGDLWAGNFLTDSMGQPVLIDPAPCYGHRESDIAMMHLFGGFPPTLFTEYQKIFPMETGWEKRIPLFQLYPLLVHARLFGGSYIAQSLSIAKSYT